MGVQTRVVVYAADRERADAAANAAYAEIGRLEQIMSDYRATSELMGLCARAGEGPVAVSADLFEVLRISEEVSRRSEGAFDATVGPVVAQWREARRSGRLAPEPERWAALSLVGWEMMTLVEGPAEKPGALNVAPGPASTAELARRGMKLDLGGIAKGYAAQRAVEILKERGAARCLVALSGDIVVGEAPPGREGWEIEVQGGHIGLAGGEDARAGQDDANGQRAADRTARLLLRNAAVSTSGDTEQFIEIDGRRYAHIVDPRTGLGTAGGLSVTVVADRGEIADALGTAVCVMGAEKGASLLRTWTGVTSVAGVVEEQVGAEVKRMEIDPGRRLRWVGDGSAARAR